MEAPKEVPERPYSQPNSNSEAQVRCRRQRLSRRDGRANPQARPERVKEMTMDEPRS
jgi:hypothetical protein